MHKSNGVSFAVLTTVHAGCDPVMLIMALSTVRVAIDGSEHSGFNAIYFDGPVSQELLGIVHHFSDSSTVIVQGETNKGPAFGLNQLLSAIPPVDFLLIHDADDCMMPGRPDSQIAFLSDNPTVSFCGGQAMEFDTHSHALRALIYPAQIESIRKAMSRRNPFAHSTVCFRGALFHEGNYRYDEKRRRVIDFELLSRMIEDGKHAANLDGVVTILLVDNTFARRRRWGYFRHELPLYLKWIRLNRDYAGVIWLAIRAVARTLPRPMVHILYRFRHRII